MLRTRVDALVDVEGGLLCKALQAELALVGLLPGVGTHVDLQVGLAREGCGALQALVRPPLHCPHNRYIHSVQKHGNRDSNRPTTS